ncbi:hypothetical protein BDF19DRAFT_86418 [Syncephalis fuscata]|nr:hypothetical protein BDF19DRAFT_86418 [Syncephalis fuscata]
MFKMTNFQHEPKRLIVTRFIIMFLVTSGLAIYLIFQLIKFFDGGDIYRLYENRAPVKVPALLFIGASGAPLPKPLVSANSIAENATKVSDNDISFNVKELMWGEDIKKSPLKYFMSLTEVSNATKVFGFYPDENWAITPYGRQKANTPSSVITSFSMLNIAFLKAITNDTMSNTESTMMHVIDELHYDQLKNARQNRRPLDVGLLGNVRGTPLHWGTKTTISILQSSKKTGSKQTAKYNIRIDSTEAILPYRIIVDLKVMNEPYDDWNFIIDVNENVKLYTFLGVISPVGGLLSIALYVFAFLFGHKRLRPWGIVQRFMMRNRILSKVPRTVAVIGSAWSTPKQNPLGHDSAIEHEESAIQHDSSIHTVPTLVSQQRSVNTTIQFAQEPTIYRNRNIGSQNSVLGDFQQLRREIEQIKTAMMLGNNPSAQEQSNTHLAPPNNNGAQARDGSSIADNRASNYNIFTDVRINDLEAFRQRVETFYLASDLFEVQGGPKANKRSTMQILTNLNL